MISENIASLLEQEVETVRSMPVIPGYEEAVSLIMKHVHDLGKKLIMSGMGKIGQIALGVAITPGPTGTPAFFLHLGGTQHGDLGIVYKNNIMLLISNSGKTRELVELVDLMRGSVPDIKSVTITNNLDSPLVAEASVYLLTGAPKEVCPLDLTPATSTTAMTVIDDILMVGTMRRIRFTNKDYAKHHHGDYLGSRSRELSRSE